MFDKVCSCGRHFGVEDWSPERRAAVARHMRDTMESLMTAGQREYLVSWEKHHGSVRYTIGVVGKNPGNVRKNDKGKDVIGAIFVDSVAESTTSDMFDKKVERKDIYA